MSIVPYSSTKEYKAAKQREYAARNKEKVRARQKAYRTSPEGKAHTKAYDKRYKQENREKVREYNRTYEPLWLARPGNREKSREIKLRYYRNTGYQKRRSVQAVRHHPEDVYRVVGRAVSSALPKHMRDDVISNMLLAVLEGELLLEHVEKRVREYVTGYNRMYDHHGNVSLDTYIPGTMIKRIDALTYAE